MADKDEDRKTTHWLEMRSPADLRPPARSAPAFELRQVEVPCPEFNWFLHQAVGAEFRWGGREQWGPAQWSAYVNQPELETWVAYVRGAPAGYYELHRQADGGVRIECFGLRRQHFGQGLGGALLARCVERCWEMGAARVWLTTCTHDHPHALQNYLARGFEIFDTTTAAPNVPRQRALFKS